MKILYCSKCNGRKEHYYRGYDLIPEITEVTGYVYAMYLCDGCKEMKMRVEHKQGLEKLIEDALKIEGDFEE